MLVKNKNLESLKNEKEKFLNAILSNLDLINSKKEELLIAYNGATKDEVNVHDIFLPVVFKTYENAGEIFFKIEEICCSVNIKNEELTVSFWNIYNESKYYYEYNEFTDRIEEFVECFGLKLYAVPFKKLEKITLDDIKERDSWEEILGNERKRDSK